MSDVYNAGTEHTHYCEDCEVELALLYDDREDKDLPVQCGHCGGFGTRPLQPDTDRPEEGER
jgi:DNA replicative helicase MCM subunit Mcm2 (Cdc46/Mcm family)